MALLCKDKIRAGLIVAVANELQFFFTNPMAI